VFDHGPHLRQRPLHRLSQFPQGLGQRLDDAAPYGDIPGDVAVGKFRALVCPRIAGIGEDGLLATMQQGCRLVDVSFVGGGASERVHHT
jgi:hypothetical protein